MPPGKGRTARSSQEASQVGRVAWLQLQTVAATPLANVVYIDAKAVT